METDTEFGFRIRDDGCGVWTVALPHQCDEWEIAWGTHEEAQSMLKEFIAEALATLSRLEGMTP